MNLPQRIRVGVATTTLACAMLAGTAMAERSKHSRSAHHHHHRSRSAGAPQRATSPERLGSDAPLGARVHAALVFYRALADWQLRSELDPSTYDVMRRALSVAVGLATARPGAALAAALTQDPPLLEERPVPGGVRSGYGVRRDPFRRRRHEKHNGVDLIAGRGVPVHAAGPGMVEKAKHSRGYGRVVFLDHGNGIQTRYAHLQKIMVQEGQFVPPGALVGKVGSSGHATGPHLHFEVRRDGRPIAPVEILGLFAPDTPLASWLDRILERIMDGAFQSTDRARDRERHKHDRGRSRHRGRSRPPTS
jgi:murein DD-endopeptidase MepM/ murein hydrolase activator NlpD